MMVVRNGCAKKKRGGREEEEEEKKKKNMGESKVSRSNLSESFTSAVKYNYRLFLLSTLEIGCSLMEINIYCDCHSPFSPRHGTETQSSPSFYYN